MDLPGEDSVNLDLAQALGAESASSQCISIYIPNKDASGNEIGTQRKWVLEAMKLLSEMNGGATVMPAVEGGWLNDQGEIIWENPIVVYSYIKTEPFMKQLPRLREYLHRLGRETQQGEMAFEFDGVFYRIRQFDP